MTAGPIVALCGGIGGAKLALGLYRVLEPDALHVVINTGDDFEHLGLHISPDVDTVTYTLAGIENPETGWGRRDETWSFMETAKRLGAETWFALGDSDLAIHVERTRRLAAGHRLSEITAAIGKKFEIRARLIPMSDDAVRTVVQSTDGALAFQDYFVRRQCKPVVEGIDYDGAGRAHAAPGVLEALKRPDLRAVIICPSNPFLSIDPILAVADIRAAVANCQAPVIAVSPLVGGAAVKGPTAKIFDELSIPRTASAIAEHYGGLIDGLIIDQADKDHVASLPVAARAVNTLMRSLDDRENLAKDVLSFAGELSVAPRSQQGND